MSIEEYEYYKQFDEEAELIAQEYEDDELNIHGYRHDECDSIIMSWFNDNRVVEVQFVRCNKHDEGIKIVSESGSSITFSPSWDGDEVLWDIDDKIQGQGASGYGQ